MTLPTTNAVSVGGVRPGVMKEIVYTRASVETPKRMVITLDGLAKEGKSHFAMTAPAPIAVHNLDLGLEGVLEGFTDKEIYEFLYRIPLSASLPGSEFTAMADAAQKVWREFALNFRDSLSKMRTVVVDTASESWALLRLARLGKLTSVLPVQYTAVNAEFRQLSQLALSQNTCNVIYTHKVKDQYKDDKKTGLFERSGFGEIEYDVQTVLKTQRDYKKVGVEQFSIEIADCRANLAASGKRFVGDDCTFSKIATAIYPNTKEEDWK
ncbi:unnamed protein product [Sphagnum jensenii]